MHNDPPPRSTLPSLSSRSAAVAVRPGRGPASPGILVQRWDQSRSRSTESALETITLRTSGEMPSWKTNLLRSDDTEARKATVRRFGRSDRRAPPERLRSAARGAGPLHRRVQVSR